MAIRLTLGPGYIGHYAVSKVQRLLAGQGHGRD